MAGRLTFAAAALGICGTATALAQQTPAAPRLHPIAEDATAFGTRESISQISLSPDGKKFAALVAQKGASRSLVVGPVDASGSAHKIAQSGDDFRISYCQWASNDRLICSAASASEQDGISFGYTRLITVHADGSGMRALMSYPGGKALGLLQNGGRLMDLYGDKNGSSVLVQRQFVPQVLPGGLVGWGGEGVGVDRIDLETLASSNVEPPRLTNSIFISDGRGAVRIVGLRPTDPKGYYANQINYQYRQQGARDWLPLSTVSIDHSIASGFEPWAVDPALNAAYGIDRVNGRWALLRMALDGSAHKETVFARADADVSSLIRIGRQQRVVGVTLLSDRTEAAFFDPELRKLQAALAKALPDFPLIRFVDSSSDENQLLIWAGSDTQPGQYMLFDKKTRHLDRLYSVRPELQNRALAPVKSIGYTAADGTQIGGLLTLPPGSDGKNLPAVVIPGGGPRDRSVWGFDWLAQFLAARGFAVLQPNYRGAAGFGDAWFQKNGLKSWKTSIGDVTDAGRWLVAQGIASPDKLAVMGASYGGYAALQSAVLDPDLFKAIVAVDPVTDLNEFRKERVSFANYRVIDEMIGNGPHLKEGSPAQNADRFKAPVLMFHGDRDIYVAIGESRAMASRLHAANKAVEFVELKGVDDSLDNSEARIQVLTRIDGFLRSSLKLPAQ